MPPPPPNFLPVGARRRRHLDPTRHLQSRELWNKVRFHASPTNDDGSNSNSNSSWLYYKALIQAVLYEIQPFRIKPYYRRLAIFLRKEDGLRQVASTITNKTIFIFGSILQICRFLYNLLRQYCTIESIQKHKLTIGKASLILIGLKLYHRTLIYLHELLHAGPILIIMTLFLLLYTIGLGENTGASSGIPSAYSVFNRGMRRILGTVDAEELARQYAGGAAAAAAAMGGGPRGNRRDGGNGMWVPHDDDDDDLNEGDENDENRLRNERRRQRRLERLQRRNNQEEDANENDNNDGNGVVDDPMGNDSGDDLDDTVIQADENAAETNNVRGAKKSGKKARRRNLELRREMQRQRQAAAANGFGRGDGDDDVAMDRLIVDALE